MEWIMKSHTRNMNTSRSEVVVGITNRNGGKNLVVSFYNNSYLKITQNLYMVCAISGNRMYFKQESEINGYKLSVNGKGVRRINLPNENNTANVGHYNIEFDPKIGLHFIDTFHKIIK